MAKHVRPIRAKSLSKKFTKTAAKKGAKRTMIKKK